MVIAPETVNLEMIGFRDPIQQKGYWAIMKTLRRIILATTGAGLLAMVAMVSAASGPFAQDQFDAGATYKAKCVACHGQKAEKKFDATLPEDQLIDFVMKGKKPEKPPNMPAYADKGITAEQAKALVENMKQLKATP